MSSIVVRGIDESVKERLAAQATKPGRSMEDEARDMLAKAASRLINVAGSQNAAICRFHDATYATRNTKDVARTGVRVITPRMLS